MNSSDQIFKLDKLKWMGSLPPSWSIAPLKTGFSIITGSTPATSNASYWDGDIAWITPADMDSTKKYVSGGDRFITQAGFESSNLTMLSPGDIVLSTRAPIGVVNVVDTPLCTNQGCKSLSPKDGFHSDYFYYVLTSIPEYLNSLGKGTTFMELSREALANILVPCPSYSEQRLIANRLDQVCDRINGIIATVDGLIDKYKEYKQSVITEAITKGIDPSVPMKESGVDWIGCIPSDWDVDHLKANFKIKKDIAGQLGFDVLSVTQNGLKIKDIESNEGQLAMDYSKYQRVLPGDFVMNHMDLLTGFVDCSSYNGVTSPDYRVFVLVNGDVICHQYALRIFQVAYWNKIFYGMGQGVSTLGRWRLPRDQFLKFMMPIPPMEEQKKIVSYIDEVCHNIDMKIQLLTDIEEKYKEYKQSVIYEYVTGKTPVEVA